MPVSIFRVPKRGRTTPRHSANPSGLMGSPKPARSRSSWRRHARVPKKPSQSPIQGWMAVALQWVRLEPDVKVRSRVTADPNRRAILVQPKSDSYLDVLFVCVRTHGSLHCTAVFKAMTTWAPLSPINRKRAGRLFQRPASSAALEGGKNQSGDPAGLARIDARVRGCDRGNLRLPSWVDSATGHAPFPEDLNAGRTKYLATLFFDTLLFDLRLE